MMKNKTAFALVFFDSFRNRIFKNKNCYSVEFPRNFFG